MRNAFISPIKTQIKKDTIFTATIVAPTGVEIKIETKIPVTAQKTEITAEHITALLKLLKIRIEARAGNIINAEIKSEPTKFIARTIIIAVIIAISKLYKSDFIPVDLANVSSKVTAKILL